MPRQPRWSGQDCDKFEASLNRQRIARHLTLQSINAQSDEFLLVGRLTSVSLNPDKSSMYRCLSHTGGAFIAKVFTDENVGLRESCY